MLDNPGVRRLKMLKKLNATALNPLDIECVSQCELCINLGRGHVVSEGNTNAKVMIVGQHPGAADVEKGRPFQGSVGQLITLMLDRAGLEREDVYLTNAVKCRTPGNRNAFAPEIRNCTEVWLIPEIKAIQPMVVVLLGKDAFSSIMPPSKLFQDKTTIPGKSGAKYVVSYHPSYYIRRGNPEAFVEFGDYLADVMKETGV